MKTYVFTNRVYPPVGGATGELLKELAEGLVAEGARVIVITSRGPAGLKLPKREIANGVELIRVGSVPFSRASHWKRALSYAGLYPQFAWQVWKLGRADAVVSMTDPPLQVAAVTLGSCRAKRRIHWAQDVYPELAEALGVIPRAGVFARTLRAVSTWALRRQDKIVVVGRCMRERLVGRGLDAGKIQVIPNWSQVFTAKTEDVAAMRKKLGWDGKFVALYSGNLGLAHDFETLVEAARRLDGTGVHVVFAGEGPRLEEVKIATAGLGNVAFLSPQPKGDLPAFFGAADLHLVSVRGGLEGLVVPSKTYGVFGAGRAVAYVGADDAEVARLLETSGAGEVLRNGDAAGLARLLRNLADNPARLKEMGEAALRAAGEITLAKALQKWQEVLG